MYIKTLFSLGLLFCSLMTSIVSLANDAVGSIVLEGRGVASQTPELVSLSVAVTSICYNSSKEASKENAKVSNQILEIFKNFKTSDTDTVTASGGANVLETETIQIGLESKIICERKWHAENHLRIEMSNLEGLANLQDQVIEVISEASGVDPNLATQTYAEFGRPEFHLLPTTAQKLKQTAQINAFDDAKSQLTALSSRCDFKNLRIVRVSPSDYNYVYKLAGERVPIYSNATPVIPDELEIEAVLRMEWQFEPSEGCRFY